MTDTNTNIYAAGSSNLRITNAGAVGTLSAPNGTVNIGTNDAGTVTAGDLAANNVTADTLTVGTTEDGVSGSTITSNGHVGIGTNSPECPLHVVGTTFQAGGQWRYFSANTGDPGLTTNPNNSSIQASIKSSGSIWVYGTGAAAYILSSSDRRIKKEIETVNDDEALNIVKNLETVKYHYTSPAQQREFKTIGFIAQEVKEVLPNAVITQKEFLPDILELIENPVWDGNKLIYDIDLSGDEYTGNVLFKYQDGDKEHDITVDSDLVFDKQYSKLYCYGREVNDFHTIDKQQIFALHHSAIQELSRKLDAVVQENTLLKERLAAIEAKLGM